MPKIDRFDGNLKAFASEQQTNERTLFGELVIADDLTSQVTPEFLRGWGIVGPSDQPTLQDFNALGYTVSQLLAYLHQMGVAEYNPLQEYYADSIVTFSGGLYISLADANTGNSPEASPSQWRKFLVSIPDATTTVKGVARFGTTAEQVAGVLTSVASNPAGVLALVTSMLPKRSFAANDYIRIPDVPGGLIIQWGVATAVGTSHTVNWPINFPNAALQALGFDCNNGAPAYAIATDPTSITSASGRFVSGNQFGIFGFLAIGF